MILTIFFLLILTHAQHTTADGYTACLLYPNHAQVYSSLAYGGPHLAMAIKRDLAALLKKDGYTSVSDAVGAEFKSATS